MSYIFDFEWGVDQHGYAIESRPPPTGSSFLKLFGGDEDDPAWEREGGDRVIRRRGGPLRFYRPMERPGLWRRFAEVASTPPGALNFVSEFGLPGEEQKDSETLAFILNTSGLLGRIARALDDGAHDDAAELFNTYARPRITARIRPPHPGARPKERRWNFSLLPLTLRSALILQAGNAITGNLKFRRCLNCPEWFLVGSGAANEKRKFCSDRCRVAWSRRPAEEREAAEGGS